MRKLGIVLIVLSALVFSGAASTAQAVMTGQPAAEENGESKKEKKQKSRTYADKIRGRNARPAPPPPKKKPKYKEWQEVTKDARVKKGLLTLYIDREDVYCEIRKDQLDTPMLAVLSLSKGIGSNRILGGLPIDDIMFDFHRTEDHIQMRRLNTRFRAAGDSALVKAIDLTFGNSILFSLSIESEDDSTGAVLVKMNDVFLSDLADLENQMRRYLGKPVRLDGKKTWFHEIKMFPTNVEIDVRLTYLPTDPRGLSLPSVPDQRYIEIGVQYSISNLPAVPMQPRLADDRVGYFLTPFKDFSRGTEESFLVHYINRWRLEKKDSTAALSEPKKPIVFYLDHTIPREYRPYIAAGIEGWQKAFEAAGFKNAIIAKDAPDDPDFDAEDARFNTIRWIVSDAPSFIAIGPSREDPRTGEILDADILIESNVVASFSRQYRRYAGPEALAEIDPFLQFIQHPFTDQTADHGRELFETDDACCDLARGLAESGAFMRLALLARGDIEAGMAVPPEFIGEALRMVAMHEVGHTLGLRHNFKSSTAVPYGRLNDRASAEQAGLAGSIMDYVPPNISLDRDTQGYYFTPTLGPYDIWAITWGYTDVPGTTPEERDESLRPLAREAWKSENRYGTDEDTYPGGALDPLCNIWDLGDDPLRFAEDRVALVRELLSGGTLEERVVEDGDNYTALRSAVETLLIQHYTAVGMAVKYMGGQYTTRGHKGDPGDPMPLDPVPAAEQRRAMAFLVKHAFSPDAFGLSSGLLNKLGDSKLRSWENNPYSPGRRFDFPMTDWVGSIQYFILARLLAPSQLQRMNEAQYKADRPYELAEYFRSLTNAIWMDRPVAIGRQAVISRNLQRNYVRLLAAMVVMPFGGTPDEAVSLARLNLLRIQSTVDSAVKTPGLSDAANAHLLETRARIARALQAQVQTGL